MTNPVARTRGLRATASCGTARQHPHARGGALPAHRRPPLARRALPAHAQPGHGRQRRSGGLPAEVQAEIRAAASSTRSWPGRPDGRPPCPRRRATRCCELMDLAVGEPVPHEYEADARPRTWASPSERRPAGRRSSDFRVVVIGAGVVGHARRDPAGGGGHRPRRAGEERRRRRHLAGERLSGRGRRHPEPPLLVLVRAAALVHPLRQARRGAQAYLRDVADAHDLRKVIRFGTEVGERGLPATSAGPSPPPAGETLTADAVITAVGQLNRPKIPPLPGLDAFRGPAVPLGALARGPRRHRQAGGGRRHRGERDADRARDRRPGRARHRLPALAAVGRAQRRVLLPHRRRRVAAHGARAVLPALVPHPAVVELQRPGARRRCRWTREWRARRPSVNAVNDGHRRVLHPLPARASWTGGPTWSRRRCRTTRRSASGCCWTTAGTRRSAATTSTWSPRRSPRSRRRACGRRTAPRSTADVVVLCTGFEAQKLLWPLDDHAAATGGRSPTSGGPTTPTRTWASPCAASPTCS